MKIVVLDGHALNPGDLRYDAYSRFGELTQYPYPPADEEETVARIGDSEIVILNKVVITEEILARCPGIRLICVSATGYNVVDIAAAKARGVTVCNVPAYGTQMVYE